jgi:hypothetical protein
MPAKMNRGQGKTMFVKEVLIDNPLAKLVAVNAAWRAAGMSGSISASLVNNVRSQMRLAGNPQGSRRKARRGVVADGGGAVGQPPGRIPSGAIGPAQVTTRRGKADPMDLEVEIDRLLMKVVEIGALPDVENALRKARRHLYASMVARS